MRLRILALLGCLLVVVSACSKKDETPDHGTVTGAIIKIDAKRIDQVEGFTLKVGATDYEFRIDPTVEYGFPLGHLHSHLTSSEPVRVEYEKHDDGLLYALSIEDG